MSLSPPALPPALRSYLEKYQQWTDRRLGDEESASTVRSVRYHFTSGATLPKILASKALWLTDHRYLNDPSEIKHGVALVRRCALAVREELGDERPKLLIDMIVDLLDNNAFDQVMDCYVACFTGGVFDISQWARYADDGRGYAISFSPSVFAVKPAPGASTGEFQGPVRYPTRRRPQRLEDPIAVGCAVFFESCQSQPDRLADSTTRNAFVGELARNIIASPTFWNCLTTKHRAYAGEKETRLAVIASKGAVLPTGTFRRRGDEVPYIARPFDITDVVRIVVGPDAPGDAEDMARTALVANGFTNTTVVRSGVPYRSFSIC